MKKLLSIIALSSLTLTLMTGCASMGSNEAHSGDYQKLTNKEIHQAIMVGGEKAGWKMTEFKENKVIAEHFEDGQGEMVTVTVNHGHVSYDGDANYGDLEDAIHDELHANHSAH